MHNFNFIKHIAATTIDVIKTFLFGWPLAIKAVKLKQQSTDLFDWFVNDFMIQEEQQYLVQYLNNIGFRVQERSRALIAQTKLPQEVYDAMGGRQNDMEDIDVYGVMEYVMHERMQGVFVQLEKHNLLDVVTLKHIYLGNGVILTMLSNVHEAEFQDMLENEPVLVAAFGIATEVLMLVGIIGWLLI